MKTNYTKWHLNLKSYGEPLHFILISRTNCRPNENMNWPGNILINRASIGPKDGSSILSFVTMNPMSVLLEVSFADVKKSHDFLILLTFKPFINHLYKIWKFLYELNTIFIRLMFLLYLSQISKMFGSWTTLTGKIRTGLISNLN